MGFVEQLVALLQREHDSTHEHLLSALLAICEDHPAALAESRRPEFLLREVDRVYIPFLISLRSFNGIFFYSF